MDEQRYKQLEFHLALHRLSGVGPARIQVLLKQFQTSRQLLDTPESLWAPNLNKQAISQLQEYVKKGSDSQIAVRAKKDIDYCLKRGIHIILFDDMAYPSLLREITAPPQLLYVHGDAELLNTRQIAIVGSRNASPVGKENAFSFAQSLSKSCLCITSGMALGVDAEAHKGALSNSDGKTIAVIASGIDGCYPARHRRLKQEIIERGAVISEFPLGTEPLRANFPRRNRIISGMSLGLLLVEAQLKSGSLISASYAIEQNRDVFAIPGSIRNSNSSGCNQLIREGAVLVRSPLDVIEEIGFISGYTLSVQKDEQQLGDTLENTQDLSKEVRNVYKSLENDFRSVDWIVEKSSMPPEKILSALVELELKGFVTRGGDGYAKR